MKKLALLPLLMLSVATIALSACDDSNKEAQNTEQTPAAVAESEMPAAPAFSVANATAFATAEGAQTGAVFLTLTNTGTTDDRLVGASAPVAASVELHESTTDEAGVMQMRKVDGIAIAAGQSVDLKAGGNHIMLMGLNAPLAEGSSFDVTLDFETAHDMVVPVSVTAAGMPMEEHTDHVMPEATTTDAPAQATTDSTAPMAEEAPVEDVAPEPTEVPTQGSESMPATQEPAADEPTQE